MPSVFLLVSGVLGPKNNGTRHACESRGPFVETVGRKWYFTEIVFPFLPSCIECTSSPIRPPILHVKDMNICKTIITNLNYNFKGHTGGPAVAAGRFVVFPMPSSCFRVSQSELRVIVSWSFHVICTIPIYQGTWRIFLV